MNHRVNKPGTLYGRKHHSMEAPGRQIEFNPCCRVIGAVSCVTAYLRIFGLQFRSHNGCLGNPESVDGPIWPRYNKFRKLFGLSGCGKQLGGRVQNRPESLKVETNSSISGGYNTALACSRGRAFGCVLPGVLGQGKPEAAPQANHKEKNSFHESKVDS